MSLNVVFYILSPNYLIRQLEWNGSLIELELSFLIFSPWGACQPTVLILANSIDELREARLIAILELKLRQYFTPKHGNLRLKLLNPLDAQWSENHFDNYLKCLITVHHYVRPPANPQNSSSVQFLGVMIFGGAFIHMCYKHRLFK